MPVADVDKFIALVSRAPTLAASIHAAQGNGGERFIATLIALGEANGCPFTRQDFQGWLDQRARAAARGELSDGELDAVAGGGGIEQYLDIFRAHL